MFVMWLAIIVTLVGGLWLALRRGDREGWFDRNDEQKAGFTAFSPWGPGPG